MRRSRNSYIFTPRRVTFAPMGMPLRSLKLEMSLLEVVMTAFWPLISDSSFADSSTIFLSCVPSPTPSLRMILTSLGTCITVV